ncbi:MAG: hypothetical protein ABI625_01920 [bacterium]
MRLATAFLHAALVAVTALSAAAQTPDLTGTWKLVPDAAASGQRMPASPQITIARDDKMLTMTRSGGQFGEFKAVYNLDGSDSKNTFNFGGNAMEQISKVKWNENKLVVTTSASFDGNAFVIATTLSLDASGNLVVDSSFPTQDGSTMTTHDTYKKA